MHAVSSALIMQTTFKMYHKPQWSNIPIRTHTKSNFRITSMIFKLDKNSSLGALR